MNQAEYEEYMFSAQFYDALNTMSKIKELQYDTWKDNYKKSNKKQSFINYCKEQFSKFIPEGYKGLVSFDEWKNYCDMSLQESYKDEDRIAAFDSVWRQYKVDLLDLTEYTCKNKAEANGIYEILKDFGLNVIINNTHLSF